MKTKGAILWGVGEEWSIEEIELGDPKEGEVQVQLAASGLCHSDEHLVTGGTPVAFYPVIGGHEGSGVVTKVGSGVTGLQEGDHVVTAFIPACGQCPPCSRGQQNLCDLGAHLLGGMAISDGTFRVTARGRSYGARWRSSTSTGRPRRASSSAAVSPTGPAPTTTTGSPDTPVSVVRDCGAPHPGRPRGAPP